MTAWTPTDWTTHSVCQNCNIPLLSCVPMLLTSYYLYCSQPRQPLVKKCIPTIFPSVNNESWTSKTWSGDRKIGTTTIWVTLEQQDRKFTMENKTKFLILVNTGGPQSWSRFFTTEHPVDLRPVCKLEFVHCGPVEKKQGTLSFSV